MPRVCLFCLRPIERGEYRPRTTCGPKCRQRWNRYLAGRLEQREVLEARRRSDIREGIASPLRYGGRP